MSTLAELTEAIKKGKRKDAAAVTEALLAAATPAGDILGALVAGMDDVGQRFKANEIFVPEVLIAARAMKTAMEQLEPHLVAAGLKPEHRVVIGTVKGDLHDIGKNLVAMMLKGANFEVIDAGTDVAPETFVEKAKESGAHIVAMSALLTTTMPAMRDTIDALKAAGIMVKTMVGGAPITDSFAKEIGADGYAADAASAVDLVKSLLSA